MLLRELIAMFRTRHCRPIIGFTFSLAAAVVFGPAALSQSLTAPPPATMTDAEFTQLLTAVRPCAGEDEFDKIPWLISIWDARERAAKEGRPILLWEMDGHPLGCG